MTAAFDAEASGAGSPADAILKAAAALWFLVAAAGQWLFVAYIVGFYATSVFTGHFELWGRNKFLIHGYVAGDTAGNLAFAAHVMMAAIITAAGTLQLVPQIRSRASWFHRLNGRVFVFTAFAISIAGLFLNATRGGGAFDHLAITLNAVLLMFCAGQTIGFAMARNFDTHRRWALRTFMLMNGVWFLRVGMMGWMVVKIGLFGGPKEFDGNFYAFWSYGSYLVPLAVLELYFRAQDSGGVSAKAAMSLLLAVLTFVTGAGVAGAAMIIWLPLLQAA